MRVIVKDVDGEKHRYSAADVEITGSGQLRVFQGDVELEGDLDADGDRDPPPFNGDRWAWVRVENPDPEGDGG